MGGGSSFFFFMKMDGGADLHSDDCIVPPWDACHADEGKQWKIKRQTVGRLLRGRNLLFNRL